MHNALYIVELVLYNIMYNRFMGQLNYKVYIKLWKVHNVMVRSITSSIIMHYIINFIHFANIVKFNLTYSIANILYIVIHIFVYSLDYVSSLQLSTYVLYV